MDNSWAQPNKLKNTLLGDYQEVAMKKLSKKQSQWAWFIGLYVAGFLVIFTIAQLIKLAMGV